MKIASIMPMKNVQETFIGDYAMLLAHLKGYYSKRSERNKNCYTIMDNSLIELGGAVSIEDVYCAARECEVDEFILPDVFRDATSTLRSVEQSIEWLRRNHHLNEMRLMAVCQGHNAESFAICFAALEQIPEIHTIGIPKVAETLLADGRPGFEQLWQGCNKEIHLLGCWTNLNEFRQYKHPATIRSADTCIPALLSVNGITDAWSDRPSKTINLLNDKVNWNNYWKIHDQLLEEGLV